MKYPSFYRGGYAILCAFFCNIWKESITFFLFLFVFISWSSSSWPFNLSTISNTHQCIAKWIRMLKISFDAKVRCHACVVVCVLGQNFSFQVILLWGEAMLAELFGVFFSVLGFCVYYQEIQFLGSDCCLLICCL